MSQQAYEQVDRVRHDAIAELADVADAGGLEAFRIKYLGTKGAFRDLMALLGKAEKEDKPALGQRINSARAAVTAAFEQKQASLAATTAPVMTVDVSEPGLLPQLGNKHVIMKTIDELTGLFGRMGFSVAAGPEVEDEFHNFIALNIPPNHPARDPNDNYYLTTATGEGTTGGFSSATAGNLPLLRTQTSTVQIRVMREQKPPIRVVIPGRVYRPDTHDATHLSMFHQLEALVVDRHVTMVDLKSTVLQFVQAYFGQATKIRLRPSFFPFTEPSAEVDVWFESKQRWIELGGCGMVHPNVFRAVGIDPEVYSGWAFGFGIERIAMRKYGVDDIRHFVENDLRFLRQF